MTEWLAIVQQQLRDIIRQLIPVEVDRHGLVAALRRLAEWTSQTHDVECSLACKQVITVVDPTLATHLYRIAQEAVTNAVRHAHATHIRNEFYEDETTLSLHVIDDEIGIGSRPDKLPGIGLRSMSYRARLMGGALEVGAGEPTGTRVNCIVLRAAASNEEESSNVHTAH